MDQLLSFAQSATPLAILAIAVGGLVFTIYSLFKGKKVDKISDVQDEKYPEIQKHLKKIEETYQDIKQKQDYIITFQTNHSLHEIPDIVKTLDKMDGKIDTLISKQAEHGERISRIEGKLYK